MEKYRLKYPIKDGDKEIAEVEIKRLKAKDLIAADKNANTEMEKSVFLIHRATGLTIETVEEMDVTDFNELSKKVVDFLG